MHSVDYDLLRRCLDNGDAGRDEWNERRENAAWGLEAIGKPLSMMLDNNVKVSLAPPNLWLVDLEGADLSGYNLAGAFLSGARLHGANLGACNLLGAQFMVTDLREADLRNTVLAYANFLDADLSGAKLDGADLVGAQMLRTRLEGATLDGCNVHGAAIWGALGEPASQENLRITTASEPDITVDDVEVAQFVYLLLHNPKIRNVLDTITSKVVLLLGRFTKERKGVLDALRIELRKKNFSPVLFDFDPSETQDISDTVTLLARMARFVIADISDPSSVQQELTLIGPHVLVAIKPIIVSGQKPWAMFDSLRNLSSGRLLKPYEYDDLNSLLDALDSEVIGDAEAKREELLHFASN